MTSTELETPIVHKSEKLAEIGRDAGWDAQIIPEFLANNSIKWVVNFTRKPEVMKVTYIDNRFVEASYMCGDKITTPSHKGAVVKVLLGRPDLTKLDGKKVAEFKSLSFSPEESPAKEILAELLGKKITWLNSISTELESETIEPHRNKGSRYYRIIRTIDNRRYVEFTTNHGFRAVYLDAIVSAH